jgi:hypothetical protein
MDYANGTRLAKWQWDIMNDPAMLVNVFENDVKSQSAALSLFVFADQIATGTYAAPLDDQCEEAKFLLSTGKIITISADERKKISGYVIEHKRLYRLVNENGKEYLFTQLIDTKEKISQDGKKVKQVDKRYDGLAFVCMSCVQEDLKNNPDSKIVKDENVLDPATGKMITTYSNIPDMFRVAYTISGDCAADKFVYAEYDVSKKKLSCIALTKEDCERKPGSPTGGSPFINLATTVTDKALQEALAQLRATESGTGIVCKLIVTDATTKDKDQQVKAITDKIGADEIMVWVDFDEQGKSRPLQFYYGSNFKSMSALQRAIRDLFKDIHLTPLTFNPLTAILDGLATLIGKLEIPERFYNPDHVDENGVNDYNDVLAEIYYYGSYINPTSLLFQKLIAPQIPDVNADKDSKYAAHKVELAFHCGLWNGVVDQAKGLPDLASWLIKILTNEKNDKGIGARDEFAQNWDTFKKDCETKNASATYGGCGWDLIWGAMKKAHQGNPCMISAQIGVDVSNLLTFFIAFAKVGKLAQVSKLMEALDLTTYIFRGGALLIRFTIPAVKYGYKLGKASIYLVIKTTEQTVQASFEIIEAATKKAMFTLDKGLDKLLGNQAYAIIQQGDMLIMGADQIPIGAKITEILDDAGKRIEDGFGNYLVQIEDATNQAAGEYQLAIAKMKGTSGSVPLAGGRFNSRVLEALDNLKDNALKDQFIKDFENAADAVVEKINANPKLVDSWKIVKDAPDAVRKNTSVLENVSSLSTKKLPNGNALDVQKLFDNGLSKTLSNVSDADKVKILNRINQWDASKVDDLARRLGKDNYPALADDLTDPAFFKLYDDIIHDPENALDIAKRAGNGNLTTAAKSTFFNDITKLGKDFESVVAPALGSGMWRDKLKTLVGKFGVNDLDAYEMFEQVQLTYKKSTGDYFVADQVFVKYRIVAGQKVIDDLIVIENKLSNVTKLTDNQSAAKEISEYFTKGVKLGVPQGSPASFKDAKIKWVRVYGAGDGKTILDITDIFN